MSQNGKTQPQVLLIDGKKIPSRITTGRLRRLKETVGLDLASSTESMQEFSMDPTTVTEVCWGLFSDRLIEAGIEDQEAFEDLCGSAEVTAIREEVVKQMRSFSGLWATQSTVMEAVQSGNIDHLMELVDKVEKMEQRTKQAATGPSS